MFDGKPVKSLQDRSDVTVGGCFGNDAGGRMICQTYQGEGDCSNLGR